MADKDAISLDSSEIQQLERVFGITAPRELKKSMRRALSRTRTGARAATSKHIRETYNVKAGRLKKDTVLTRANYNSFSFRIIGRPHPIGLLNFSSRGGPARQTKAGVSVAVKLGGRKVIRHAFIAQGLGGGRQVFTRYGKGGALLPRHRPHTGANAGRLVRKIRALKGPSVADMFDTTEIHEMLATTAHDRFSSELSRNLKHLLGR